MSEAIGVLLEFAASVFLVFVGSLLIWHLPLVKIFEWGFMLLAFGVYIRYHVGFTIKRLGKKEQDERENDSNGSTKSEIQNPRPV